MLVEPAWSPLNCLCNNLWLGYRKRGASEGLFSLFVLLHENIFENTEWGLNNLPLRLLSCGSLAPSVHPLTAKLGIYSLLCFVERRRLLRASANTASGSGPVYNAGQGEVSDGARA